MAEKQITISTDALGDANFADVVATHHDQVGDMSIYHLPNHAVDMRKIMQFYRTPQKRNGNFRGVFRSAVKTTIDVAVPGYDQSTSVIGQAICHTQYTFPVGMTEADRVAFRRQHLQAQLIEAEMAALNSVGTLP